MSTPTQYRVSVTRSTQARTFRLTHVPAESSILSIPRACINLRCSAVLDDDTTPTTEDVASNYIKLELHLAYAHAPFEFRIMKVNKPQSLKPRTLGHGRSPTPRVCIDPPLKVLKGILWRTVSYPSIDN